MRFFIAGFPRSFIVQLPNIELEFSNEVDQAFPLFLVWSALESIGQPGNAPNGFSSGIQFGFLQSTTARGASTAGFLPSGPKRPTGGQSLTLIAPIRSWRVGGGCYASEHDREVLPGPDTARKSIAFGEQLPSQNRTVRILHSVE